MFEADYRGANSLFRIRLRILPSSVCPQRIRLNDDTNPIDAFVGLHSSRTMNAISPVQKRVIFVAYYFPPEGNAAVYRSLRFLKELVKKDWRASVICCEPYQFERYDPRLLHEVPSETRIIRVKGPDPWRAFQTWRGVRVGNLLATAAHEKA